MPFISPPFSVFDIAAGHLELQERDSRNDDGKDDRLCARQTVLIIGKGVVVDQQADHRGGVVRAAAGHHVSVHEHLEGADDAGNQQEQGGGLDQREYDAGDLLHEGRAVQLGRLEVGVIDTQQGGGVDDDVLALAGKQRHDHQGQHRGLAGTQPVLDGQMEEGEQLVEQAGGRGIVDPQPHHRKRDAGGNGGQVVHGLKDRLQLLFKGHDKDGHREGDQQRKRHDHGGVDQRIFEGLPEQSVGEGGLSI